MSHDHVSSCSWINEGLDDIGMGGMPGGCHSRLRSVYYRVRSLDIETF
jgi:hypothetical protein